MKDYYEWRKGGYEMLPARIAFDVHRLFPDPADWYDVEKAINQFIKEQLNPLFLVGVTYSSIIEIGNVGFAFTWMTSRVLWGLSFSNVSTHMGNGYEIDSNLDDLESLFQQTAARIVEPHRQQLRQEAQMLERVALAARKNPWKRSTPKQPL